MKIARMAMGLAAIALLGAGVIAMRRATLSTHYRQDPRSTIRVVVEVRSKGAEPSQTLDELAEAQLIMCRLEVKSDPVGEVTTVSRTPRRYAIVLRPGLDSTDRKQYEGCIEDWTIDHQLVHVVSMTDGTEGS